MKRKYLTSALAVALVVFAVAAGVHVMNKEAHATAYYQILCLQRDGEDCFPIQGIVVDITIGNEAPVQEMTDQTGFISVSRNYYASWTAEIVDAQGLGDPTDGDPCASQPAFLTTALMQVWYWDI